MQHLSLQLSTYGSGTVPIDWTLEKKIEMQRLYYIKSGTGSFQLFDGTRQPFQLNCFYLFPYNFPAIFFSDANDPIDHVYFDFVSMPPFLANIPLCIPAKTKSLAHFAAVLQETVLRHNERDYHFGYALLSLALELLNKECTIPFNTDPVVSSALTFIWNSYHLPITISDLALQSHLEVNHFIRRFKSVMGQTPYAYVRTYRLTKAIEYIHSGNSIAQAAEKVGYRNASSLSRALRALPNLPRI